MTRPRHPDPDAGQGGAREAAVIATWRVYSEVILNPSFPKTVEEEPTQSLLFQHVPYRR
jgi:hypothetical protein